MRDFTLSLYAGLLSVVALILTVGLRWPGYWLTLTPGVLIAFVAGASLCLEMQDWCQRRRRRTIARIRRALRKARQPSAGTTASARS